MISGAVKSWSLKFKLFLASTLLVVGTVVIITASTLVNMRTAGRDIREHSTAAMREAVFANLAANAGAYGERVQNFINGDFAIPSSLAGILSKTIEWGFDRSLSRDQVQDLNEALILSHDNINSIYTRFEANGFDGRDDSFSGATDPHSTEAGTLEVLFERDQSGKITQKRITDATLKYRDKRNEFGFREAEWYLCVKDTKKPCLMEPYLFEISPGHTELMTSLTVPVMVKGEFRGVTGVDIVLPVFQKMMEELSKNLYGGHAKVTLLSETGLIAGSSQYQSKIGRPLKEAVADADQLVGLSRGSKRLETADEFIVSEPINITNSGSHWSLLIQVPKDLALADVASLNQDMKNRLSATLQQQVIIGLIVVIVGIGLMSLLVRSITTPIRGLSDRMQNLASSEGDLTRQVQIETHEELIRLAGGFNGFLEKLRHMIIELKRISGEVRGQAQESARIAAETDRNTSRQHAEIDSVVTAMNQMSAAASEVANFAGDAANQAKDARLTVENSQATLSSAVNEVKVLADDMATANGAIAQVAQRSDDINRIVDVIRSIAEQTNLLALNAAIEAARAGEAGRGFAVVADEVRTLASRTRTSTDEISQLITNLQSDVKATVNVVTTGVSRATGAVEKTDVAFDALVKVVDLISAISDHITQVATASEQQSSVSEEINRNLTIIGDAASQVAELTREAMLSSDSLQHNVEALDEQLGRLRT